MSCERHTPGCPGASLELDARAGNGGRWYVYHRGSVRDRLTAIVEGVAARDRELGHSAECSTRATA